MMSFKIQIQTSTPLVVKNTRHENRGQLLVVCPVNVDLLVEDSVEVK